MARPRKDNRKDVRLTARFTEAEANTVNTAADAAGVTVSDLLRSCVLETPLPKRSRRKPVVQYADELAAVLRGIGRIGNNINQLAKVANAGSWPEAGSIQDARTDIQWMRQAVMKALGYPPAPEAPDTPPDTSMVPANPQGPVMENSNP